MNHGKHSHILLAIALTAMAACGAAGYQAWGLSALIMPAVAATALAAVTASQRA